MFFLHCLEQRGLRFRRCPIDFISKDQVREDGTALELKLAATFRCLNDKVVAKNVRWH